MKRKIFSGALLALTLTASVNAQNIYDAMKMTTSDLTGTARYVGMGGAMGALGGDISTMATNPAGIGVYRSNDIMFTLGYTSTDTKSNYEGVKYSNNHDRFDLANVGVVFSLAQGNVTPLRFVNVGINYKRNKALNKIMEMNGNFPTLYYSDGSSVNISQINQLTAQANAMYDAGYDLNSIDDGNTNLFRHNNVGYLAALGWLGNLVNPLNTPEGNRNGFTGYVPYTANGYFYSKESGGVDQIDFNVSFNVSDRYYFGATFGFYDVNYKKSSFYDEDFGQDPVSGVNEYYTLESWNKTTGVGVDFKLGAIVRPFEYSPFRVGLAIHTPTFWDLSLRTGAAVTTDVVNASNTPLYVSTYNNLGGRTMTVDYRLLSPWKFNLSTGYTFGTTLALGAEFEYADYSHTKFKYNYDDFHGTMPWETSTAKDMLKGISTFKIGAELRFVPEFALRAGYNVSTAAFKSDAWKDLPYNSVVTDTDYANSKINHNYTFGFGYRGPHVYVDMSYKYNTYKEDFYAFYDADIDYGSFVNDLPKTKVTNNTHQLLVTLGYRF